MNTKFSQHKQKFIDYADRYISLSEEPCLILKKEHTFRVLKNTEKIISALTLSEEDAYCAKLIALYHDIGRFIQYEKYKTFLDKKSENHAWIAIKILKQYPFFLEEPQKIRNKVLSAVILHNALSLPTFLPKEYQLLSQIIRDADKLDIMYVMAMNFTQSLPEKDSVILHVKDDPYLYTKKILTDAMQKKMIKYTELAYVNDFKILLCAWIFFLYLPKSKELLQKEGFYKIILNSLPVNDEILSFQKLILSELEK